MGTRGLVGFKIDGNLILSYLQYDAYPDGVGKGVLDFASKVQDWDAVREVVRSLTQVDESDIPTPEELAQYHATTGGQYADYGVSNGQDWYSLLRHTQGDLSLILASGYIASIDPAGGVEYSYVIDLDANTFTSYTDDVLRPSSFTKILKAYPLDALPSEETYLKDTEESYDE